MQAGWDAAASSAQEPGDSQLPQSPEAMAGTWPMVTFGAGIPLLQPLVPTQLPNALSTSCCRGGQLAAGREAHAWGRI